VTVVAMASLRGAPGTTTAALGLAAVAATRQPALLIEADPAGGVLIGRCADLEGAPTLEQLAFPDREAAGLPFPALLERSMQRIGDLPVAVAPGDPFRASASVAGHRSRWVGNVHHLDALVVIDCGRLYPGSPAATIVRQADVVVLVCAPDGSDVVTAREWAMSQLELTGDRSVLRDPPVLLTVGPGRYRPWRLARELGDQYLGALPYDPRAVSLLLRGGSPSHRALRRLDLVRALNTRLDEVLAHGDHAEVRA
jgi:hypothetical protein